MTRPQRSPSRSGPRTTSRPGRRQANRRASSRAALRRRSRSCSTGHRSAGIWGARWSTAFRRLAALSSNLGVLVDRARTAVHHHHDQPHVLRSRTKPHRPHAAGDGPPDHAAGQRCGFASASGFPWTRWRSRRPCRRSQHGQRQSCPTRKEPLTFAGNPAVTVPAGEDVWSDPVALTASAGQDLAILSTSRDRCVPTTEGGRGGIKTCLPQGGQPGVRAVADVGLDHTAGVRGL